MKHHNFLLFVSAILFGCTADTGDRYNVDIRWTSYGIPHVKADDWGSLGYGFAYATVNDGICVFARELARANGTLTADFGESDDNLASDTFHRAMITSDKVQKNAAAMSENMRKYSTGFVAGYNRFFEDHRENLPADCAGEKWVRPINELELGRMFIAFGIRYGTGLFTAGIAAAAPPGEPVAAVQIDYDATPGFGSNAIALGSDLTRSGRGILFGNPHYPWHGPARFHMIHTTIPGEVDTMGASLLTGNIIVIGFNKDVAWTHTVSTAIRRTLFELELNPENPMQYRHGGEFRDIELIEVSVPLADGESSQRIYMTQHGPILVSNELPWTRTRAYAVRDAILGNDAVFATYEALQTAASIADVEAAISKQGVYFVNTIAADRHGKAFYADISSTPHLDMEILENCRREVAGLPPRFVILDGSSPECDWRVDPQSTVPGNLPADDMPRATSTRYFTNSNDSYWLSNPDEPLEGYLPTIGPERTARTLRTRAGLVFLNEYLQQDNKLEASDIQTLLFSHRHFGAELLLDDVLEICENDDAVALSCDVLRNWDRRANVDSQGMQVWTEFWETARNIDGVYAVPFDEDDPVNTPRGVAIGSQSVRDAVRETLAAAQERLLDAGIGLDQPWGDVQFAERNGSRIPVPGGPGHHGMFSYIRTDFTEGKGYTPIVHGNSYIQVVTWDGDGSPDARAILTYSQSPQADSPQYYDQTELYARGEWLQLPFTEDEILADPNLKTLTLRGE
ncbi:MAG: penicillin acylase family protein [Gammaproteobacteria bacterium]|nr:penicillin acylase family protein [Gammaproteobacteria bacterium]